MFDSVLFSASCTYDSASILFTYTPRPDHVCSRSRTTNRALAHIDERPDTQMRKTGMMWATGNKQETCVTQGRYTAGDVNDKDNARMKGKAAIQGRRA